MGAGFQSPTALTSSLQPRTWGADVTGVTPLTSRGTTSTGGVVPDAMRFCFEPVTDSTSLQGAELVIDEPAGAGHCRSCGRDLVLTDLILVLCGSADVDVVAGN